MKLIAAPYEVRVFGMACWSNMQPEGGTYPRSYLPYWRFLDDATYDESAKTLTYGAHVWSVPAMEATNA